MPPAIIGAVVAIGAAAGAAAGIITATTALVIGIAASAAGALLTKTQSFNFDSYTPQSERKQVIRAAAASRTVIYGTTVSSGVLVFAEEEPGVQEPDKHGENHEKLTLVLALAGHELTAVGQVWLGDDAIESFGDKASYVIHNNPTKVSQDMLNRCPSWKSDMIGKGICWMQLNLVFDSEKFPSGLPNVKCLKKGRKVLDPRTGKMVFSNNAALVILDYLRVYLKRSDDAILWDQFKEAANICDESVRNADNTFEPRYTINGEFDIDEAPSKILEDMLDACGGELTYIGGKHGILVGAYYGPPELTLDTSCIAGDIKITPETAFKERTNTITGTYIDPLQNYQEADFPPVSVAEWIQQDGQEITQDVDYRFVTSPYQAQRLSNLTLKRKRIGRSIEIPCNMRGYRFRPGMYVYVDIPNIGMNKVEMRVIKWQFDPKGGVTVTVRQDFPDLWDDAIGKPVERPDLVDLPTGGAIQPQNLHYKVLQISDVVQGLPLIHNSE
ncbi:phage tail protein, partial [Sulfoacidibacillus thermotolerans]